MGRQFNFIMDSEDEEKFFSYMQENGVIYSYHNSTQLTQIQKEWDIIYFYREDFGKLITKILSGNRVYIDSLLSPVIEFCNTYVCDDDKKISRGRLYLEMQYWNEEEVLVRKSDLLEQYYKQFVKWIKKNLKCIKVNEYGKEKKEYISESLVSKVMNGYHCMY